MIEDLESRKDSIQYGRGPDKADIVFDLRVWYTDLIVLYLLIDIIELQVEFVDHRSVSKIASTFGWLPARYVDPV